MIREQKRISIDPTLWAAVEAAAKAKGMPLHIYVERALQIAIGPFKEIENAAELASEVRQSMAEIEKQIHVIADFVVDSMNGSRSS